MEENVRSIVTASEAAGVFTLAGSPIDVERGLVIGLRVSAGSKKLVVNMAAAERTGVDFDAVVRQVALRVGNTPAKKDRDELRQTLVRYTEAIQERDLDALRGVWPALEGDDEKRIVASFKMARSHTIFFAVLRIEHQGEKAQARVRRTDKLVTRDGQTITAGALVEISFSKVGDGAWQIDSMAKANPLFHMPVIHTARSARSGFSAPRFRPTSVAAALLPALRAEDVGLLPLGHRESKSRTGCQR